MSYITVWTDHTLPHCLKILDVAKISQKLYIKILNFKALITYIQLGVHNRTSNEFIMIHLIELFY